LGFIRFNLKSAKIQAIQEFLTDRGFTLLLKAFKIAYKPATVVD
jgi:hypothetical protein